jgi:hypothetical protein
MQKHICSLIPYKYAIEAIIVHSTACSVWGLLSPAGHPHCWVRRRVLEALLYLSSASLTQCMTPTPDGNTHWTDKVEERENKSSRNYRRTQQCGGWAAIPPRAFTTRHSNDIHRHPPPPLRITKSAHLLGASEDIGVTGIEDGHGGATEQLTAGGTKLNLWVGISKLILLCHIMTCAIVAMVS